MSDRRWSDEAPYQIGISSVPVGHVSTLDAADLTHLEQAMSAASKKLQNIICHELFVTASNDVAMVFMTYKPV